MADGEDLPPLQACKGPFDGGSECAGRAADCFVSCGSFPARWSVPWCDEAGAEVTQMSDALAFGEDFEGEGGGPVPGVHVVTGARHPIETARRSPRATAWRSEPVAQCLPKTQPSAHSLAVSCRDQSAVHQDVPTGRRFGGVGNTAGQDLPPPAARLSTACRRRPDRCRTAPRRPPESGSAAAGTTPPRPACTAPAPTSVPPPPASPDRPQALDEPVPPARQADRSPALP